MDSQIEAIRNHFGWLLNVHEILLTDSHFSSLGSLITCDLCTKHPTISLKKIRIMIFINGHYS